MAEYELRTIKDIFDKVPADRIKTCMEELATLIIQAKAIDGLFWGIAAEIAGKESVGHTAFPDMIVWNDDDKGKLTLNLQVNGEKVMTVETTKEAANAL